MEIAEKYRKIRSFYAKKRIRNTDGTFAKQYASLPGIVIVTCLANGMQYFARSMDVRKAVSKWRSRIRVKKTAITAIDTDLEKYGPEQFSVKVGVTLSAAHSQLESDIKIRLDIAFREYANASTKVYNKLEVTSRYITLYERTAYKNLGSIRGKSEQRVDRTSNICGPVVFVITCKETRRRYVSGVQNFEVAWFQAIRQLRRGTFTNKELQSEWNEYGEGNFIADFIRVDSEDRASVREIKRMVLRSFDKVYHNSRKKKPGLHTSGGGELAS